MISFDIGGGTFEIAIAKPPSGCLSVNGRRRGRGFLCRCRLLATSPRQFPKALLCRNRGINFNKNASPCGLPTAAGTYGGGVPRPEAPKTRKQNRRKFMLIVSRGKVLPLAIGCWLVAPAAMCGWVTDHPWMLAHELETLMSGWPRHCNGA